MLRSLSKPLATFLRFTGIAPAISISSYYIIGEINKLKYSHMNNILSNIATGIYFSSLFDFTIPYLYIVKDPDSLEREIRRSVAAIVALEVNSLYHFIDDVFLKDKEVNSYSIYRFIKPAVKHSAVILCKMSTEFTETNKVLCNILGEITGVIKNNIYKYFTDKSQDINLSPGECSGAALLGVYKSHYYKFENYLADALVDRPVNYYTGSILRSFIQQFVYNLQKQIDKIAITSHHINDINLLEEKVFLSEWETSEYYIDHNNTCFYPDENLANKTLIIISGECYPNSNDL